MQMPAEEKVLYVYCHPLPDSFHAAIRDAALDGLARSGHAVDLLDLYAEGFEPALSATERRHYYEAPRNAASVGGYAARLMAADTLVLQFPTWCLGPPAMIKGFVDRVMIPGIAFDISDGRTVTPLLGRIRRIVGIVTYGQRRWQAFAAGDHPRRFVTRHLRWIAAPKARAAFLALYGMDDSDAPRRQDFLDHVRRRMAQA